MKKSKLLILPFLAMVSISHAAVTIINNNFDAVTAGDFNGQLGDAFGVASELGNATANRSALPVASSGGVGGSQWLGSLNPAIRSRDAVDISTAGKVTFSAYFKYASTAPTQAGGVLQMGWALPAATDNVLGFNNKDDRIIIGVRRNTSGNLQFAANGVLAGTGVGSPTMTPANNVVPVLGDWYQVSFDLTFNLNSGTPADSTITVDNYKLFGWGSDGVTGGNLLMSSTAASTFNPTYGTNLNTSTLAHAFVIGDSGRGMAALDNVLVTAVPEPSTYAALAGLLALGFVVYRRRRR
jgi:hypothetical protein